MDNAAQNSQNVQDSFLNTLRRDRINVTIYLMGGVKLTGKIKSFDKFSLVLESGNLEQLIFKHAISTVVTMKAGHAYASVSQSASHGSVASAQHSTEPARPDSPES